MNLAVAIPVFLMVVSPAWSSVVVPVSPIRAGTVISYSDVTLLDENIPGVLTEMQEVIGREAKVNLYPGRPIRIQDIGSPTIIRRNSRVQIIYRTDLLRIVVDGRALSPAGLGESVQVMNSASRMTVVGMAVGPNLVEILK
jgi:flagella basal body P-ring formation protein FlgA